MEPFHHVLFMVHISFPREGSFIIIMITIIHIKSIGVIRWFHLVIWFRREKNSIYVYMHYDCNTIPIKGSPADRL